MTKPYIRVATGLSVLLASAMIWAIPAQAVKMTACEKKHFDFYYLGKDWNAADAYKKAKQLCKTVKAKEKKKKSYAPSFGLQQN